MDNQKEIIVYNIGKILPHIKIKIKKLDITNTNVLNEENKMGWSFTAKKGEKEFKCFAGFITEEKYKDTLIFEIAEDNNTEALKFLNFDKDTSGNLITDKESKLNLFFNKKEEINEKKLTEWLGSKMNALFILHDMGNVNYKKIGFKRRLFLIELPWFVFLSSIGLFMIWNEISDDSFFSTYVIISAAISFIALLATMKFKSKVRSAIGLEWKLNPWTWFVSYTARICFGVILCPAYYIIYGSVIVIKKTVPILWKILKKILSWLPYILGGFLIILLNSATESSGGGSSGGGSSYSGSYGGSSSGGGSSSASRRQNYYCEYCGQKYSSISSLTMNNCSKHPAGWCKGKHKLYEGTEKSEYYCKYCGQKYSSISSLTMNNCPKHPAGWCKGRHSPAL